MYRVYNIYVCLLYISDLVFISIDYNGIRFRAAAVDTVYMRAMRIITIIIAGYKIGPFGRNYSL